MKPYCCGLYGKRIIQSSDDRLCHHPKAPRKRKDKNPRIPDDHKQPGWCPIEVIPLVDVHARMDEWDQQRITKYTTGEYADFYE